MLASVAENPLQLSLSSGQLCQPLRLLFTRTHRTWRAGTRNLRLVSLPTTFVLAQHVLSCTMCVSDVRALSAEPTGIVLHTNLEWLWHLIGLLWHMQIRRLR